MTVTATPTDVRARALAARMLAAKGRTLLLRQPTRVEIPSGPDAGLVVESPLSTRMLRALGAFTAGASVLSLDADVVKGLLVAGDKFTVAGNAQVYTVTGGPYAANGNILASVAFTPALVANVADNAAVTVSFDGTDTLLKGYPENREEMVAGKLTLLATWQVLVAQSALDDAGVVVSPGDILFDGDSDSAQRGRVLGRKRIASGELDAAITLLLEAA